MAIRFKTDENLPEDLAAALRALDYDTMTVREQGLAGHSDASVLTVCRDENRVVITLDRGFGDRRRLIPSRHAGVVVLRPRTQSRPDILDLVSRLSQRLANVTDLRDEVWIVSDRRIRIRR
ncbi:MAG: DUF5615 family PIN-like protein [Phycisphaerales bacterium]